MPLYFLIIPIMAATVMSATSFVGEKEKQTLETLLYCPLSLKQIFRAKVLASFLLSMLVSGISFVAMVEIPVCKRRRKKLQELFKIAACLGCKMKYQDKNCRHPG